jgi:AbrB family looped-hinge helix DNA binding protein
VRCVRPENTLTVVSKLSPCLGPSTRRPSVATPFTQERRKYLRRHDRPVPLGAPPRAQARLFAVMPFFATLPSMKASIDSAGRIVVPKALRLALGLKSGQPLEMRMCALPPRCFRARAR